MSETLGIRLDKARAEVARLERQALSATCAEIGHDWQMMGGVNCQTAGGCGDCSVAVHECSRCKDCDYGESDEANRQVEACRCALEKTP